MTPNDHPVDDLAVADLIEIAEGIIGPFAVRDIGLLASAAGRPQSSVFGDDAYPTFAGKAAALIHSLARNHALVDGNKRLAWSGTRVVCLLNGHDLEFTVEDAEAFVLAIAQGDLDVPEITTTIAGHLR